MLAQASLVALSSCVLKAWGPYFGARGRCATPRPSPSQKGRILLGVLRAVGEFHQFGAQRTPPPTGHLQPHLTGIGSLYLTLLYTKLINLL